MVAQNPHENGLTLPPLPVVLKQKQNTTTTITLEHLSFLEDLRVETTILGETSKEATAIVLAEITRSLSTK